MFFLVVLLVVALVAVVVAMQPQKSQDSAPASLKDFTVPTAEKGKPIPVVFGTVLVQSPNVVWYGDLYYKAIKSGGGGGK
jgi:hypothetical protein